MSPDAVPSTGDEQDRSGQHAFAGAKNFAVENANFKSAGRNLTIFENCNIVGPTGVPVVEVLVDDPRAEEDTKLFRWVVDGLMKSNVNFKSTHSDALSKRTTGTGLWFMQTDEYTRWTANGLQILWGNGMPGAGKTVLSSIIIDHLQKEFSGRKKVAVIYAYCRYTESYSATQIFASWIRDLLEQNPSTFKYVREAFSMHRKQETRPSQSETLDLLCSLCCAFEKVYIVLDGLDESTDEVKQDLLEGLATLPRKAHALIMSRPLHLYKYLAPEAVFLDIEARNEDIELFVDKRIHQIPRLRMLLQGKDSAKTQVYSQIKEKSGGMFLVASLQIEAIKNCMSIKSLLKALETLPTGVDDLYRGTLDRINAQGEEEADLAKRAILWIINVFELLSIEQLQHALAVSLDPEAFDIDDVVRGELIVAVCCGLVVVDQTSQKVRLIHYTASDFLKTQCPSWFSGPHTLISSSCIAYLSTFQLQEANISSTVQLNYFLDHQPLLQYAYTHWGKHARQSCQETEGLSDIVSNFILQASGYPWIIKIHQTDYFDLLEPEHLATVYGLMELLRILPGEARVTPNHKFTLLHMAAVDGHVEIARDVLEKYPELTLNDESSEGGTPVVLAAACGHEELIEFFLSHRSSQKIKINSKLSCGCTALSLALEKNNKNIVTMLLSKEGVDINTSVCNAGTTPLIWASQHGHASVVRRLLGDPAIDVNAGIDTTGGTALMEACNAENAHIVKLLLAHDKIDVNAHKSCGCNTVLLAAKFGRLHIVSLLSSHPAINIHLRCGSFGTSISAPSGPGADSILKVVLSTKNLIANATDDDIDIMFHTAAKLGLTTVISSLISALQKSEKPVVVHSKALVEAARQGHVTIVRMLLQYADVNGEDVNDISPLCAAATAGLLVIIELLLARKDILVNKGREPALLCAARCGHTSIVKRLLRYRGIEVNGRATSSEEWEWETPITAAAREGHWEIVDIFLSQSGVQVGYGPSSPLIYACAKGNQSLVQKLLARDDVDVGKRDLQGWTAITHAASKGHTSIYRLLTSIPGVEVNSEGLPLIEAAAADHEEIIRLILTNLEVNPNQVNSDGWTGLSKAAYSGSEKAVETLLSHPGIDVNAGLPSPIVQASKGGHVSVVKMLLSHEATDVNARDVETYKSTAFSWACQNGHLEIVKLLLDRPDIDINVESTCGCNCLSWALKGAFATIATSILSSGKSINVNVSCKQEGTSPLRFAASTLPDIVPLLLAVPEIDVNAEAPDGEVALTLASYSNFPNAVSSIIAHPGVDLEKFGHRALIAAVGQGNAEVAKILLNSNAIDINQTDSIERTAISAACSSTSTGVVDLFTILLSFPQIDPNLGKPPPLHAAASAGQRQLVELLLSNGAIDVNMQNEVGYTALAEACHNDCQSVVSLLLSHPDVDVNCGKYPPLTILTRLGRTTLIHKLLRHPSIDVNAEDWGGTTDLGRPRAQCSSLSCSTCFPKPRKLDVRQDDRKTALAHAVQWEDENLVKLLLSQPHIHASLDAVFTQAMRTNNKDIIDMFLAQEGVNVNVRDVDGDTALFYCVKTAASAGAAIQKLLQHDDIDVNTTTDCGCTPLVWACRQHKEGAIDSLLAHPNIDPTSRCVTHGRTALLEAAHRGDFDIVLKLMEAPEHGDILDFNEILQDCGCSVLALAAKTGDGELVSTILSRTDEAEARHASDCKSGRTPLLWACHFGDDDLAKTLLSDPDRLNINHKDKEGFTALMLAVNENHEEIVRTLLSSNAVNVNLRNAKGESALSLAAWGGNAVVVRLLLSRYDIDIGALEGRAYWKDFYPSEEPEKSSKALCDGLPEVLPKDVPVSPHPQVN